MAWMYCVVSCSTNVGTSQLQINKSKSYENTPLIEVLKDLSLLDAVNKFDRLPYKAILVLRLSNSEQIQFSTNYNSLNHSRKAWEHSEKFGYNDDFYTKYLPSFHDLNKVKIIAVKRVNNTNKIFIKDTTHKLFLTPHNKK